MQSIRHIALLIGFFWAGWVSGQQPSATLYYMDGIPQRTFLNPALQPESRLFIGNPGFSQLHLQVNNSGFSLNDLITRTDTGNLLDIGKAISSMPSINQLSAGVRLPLVSFGFRMLKHGYLTFDVAPRTYVGLYYPRDLFGMLWKGNGDEEYLGKRIKLDGMGIEASVTNEYSLGYSHQILEGLTVGVRGRFIHGLVNIHTERFVGGLYTQADNFTLVADLDVKINANVPLVNIDSLIAGKKAVPDKIPYQDIPEYLRKNKGGAVDVGLTYRWKDRFFFSASVNDLGYINWYGNPYNYTSKGEFTFEGIDFSEYIVNPDSAGDFSFEDLADSIMDIFKFEKSYNGYQQRLSPSFQLGAAMYLTRDDALGFLFRNQFYKGIWYPRMTFSYNHRFGRILSLTGSYALERGSFANIGVGMGLKLGPFQYYLITDNAMALAYPYAAREVGVLTGINWLFGSRPKKEPDALPAI